MNFQWRRGLRAGGNSSGNLRAADCVGGSAHLGLGSFAGKSAGLESGASGSATPPDAVKPADEGETVTFSPCGMWYHTPLPQRIIVLGELPAAAVSRWGEPCPPIWSLAGLRRRELAESR